MLYSRTVSTLFLLYSFCVLRVAGDCTDVSYSSPTIELEDLKKINRIAVSGHISAYKVEISISDAQFTEILKPDGNSLVIYSTLSHVPSWTHVDILAKSIRIRNAFGLDYDDTREPLLMLTVCDYESRITAFDDSPYTVDSSRSGLVSMYENELILVFRSFRSGIFFYSMADQGDILIAQVVHGSIQVIFDFGSLSPAQISGGRALDDGNWHEVRWLHQFDSVQLFIDGVLLNQTTPTGLYRKLDLHDEIHIAGRPSDDYSEGIESSFTGCLARIQLNSVDILQTAPRNGFNHCQMPRPPSLTLQPGAVALIPFSFLPFSFEFRILPLPSALLNMLDAENNTLLKAEVDDTGILVLSSNVTKYKQKANPAISVAEGAWHSFSLRIRRSRLEVDIDGYTVLWLEGQEVRRISVRLASLVLSSPGCYRSATVDFGTVRTEGETSRGECRMNDRCLPSPCENGGSCVQTTLDDYDCHCAPGYRGKNCHTSDMSHSCEEWLYNRHSKKVSRGRNVTLDIDGGGALAPFQVTCRTEKDEFGMDTITTILNHDLLLPMIVTGDNKPGAVKKSLIYGISTEQLDRLVEGFDSCTQWMSFKCRGGARLMTYSQERTPSSWYSTRSEKHGLQWGDAPPYSRMCSCAVNGTCRNNRMCNCDSGEDSVDEGVNSYSQLLPVTALFLGGTTKTSSVEVEIGPLMCRTRVTFEPVTFTDRNARLTGTRSLRTRTFDILMHVKFTHLHMTIFVWESADALHWFYLYVHNGKIVGELVNGGETMQISSGSAFNDGRWHSIYWEADRNGMRLRMDGRTQEENAQFILPAALHWTFGSRTGRGSTGFAGVIRNVYLCGEELMLTTATKREGERGIAVGEEGYCRIGLCKNGGKCVDKYDGYECDCSMTPFGGKDCTKEYGMWVPLGSSLEIPWQNPAHTSMCHRIAIQTRSTNVSLIQSKALFADSTFNMTIDQEGHLSIFIYDGHFFNHQKSDTKRNLSDDIMHDISFCANRKDFNLTIDGDTSIHFEGNWTFFQYFNVWTFLDSNYTGCVSRLQVGSSFPLKNPKSARLSHSENIRFGRCPMDTLEISPSEKPRRDSEEIFIHAISDKKQQIISVTSIGGLSIAGILIVLLSVLVCYMRSRPEGVYKTNEGAAPDCSPSRSEEPLVRAAKLPNGKEYFC